MTIIADSLIEQCSKLQIEDQEREVVDFGEIESSESNDRVSLMLVGKLLTDRPFYVEGFKRTMTHVWSLSSKVVIRVLAPNLFAFQFFHWRDKDKVLDGRPWCFDHRLLILNEIHDDEQPSQVSLNTSPFWIRIHNLPFNCRSEPYVKAVASPIGTVLEIDDDDFGLERDCRVRVMMDVNKTLRRKQDIKKKDGSIITVEFKYERLPYFCFMCGFVRYN